MNDVYADVLRARGQAQRGEAELATTQQQLTTDLATLAGAEAELGGALKTSDAFDAVHGATTA